MLAGGAQGGEWVSGRVELHGDGALVAEATEGAEDVVVVHLAGARFVASRDVGDVNEIDRVDILVELFDEVPLAALLVAVARL